MREMGRIWESISTPTNKQEKPVWKCRHADCPHFKKCPDAARQEEKAAATV